MTQHVFRQIILLDEPRILTRLRSRHMEQTRKNKKKPIFLDLLSNTLNDPSIKFSGQLLNQIYGKRDRVVSN